jgi:hypothetical protein
MNAFDYLKAAFNARPLGMPIPPNWLALAAFGLLGGFISPGFWVLGAGLELAYLYWLANSERFRRTVAANQTTQAPVDQRYLHLLERLNDVQRERQHQLEARAREVFAVLSRSSLMSSHIHSLEQLVWLNLRLLVARQALAGVVEVALQDSANLKSQEDQLDARLADAGISPELRRSLEQQKAVIDARQVAHIEAARRLEHVDAELQRIDQQVALIREQALLATDEDQVAIALDALAASFSEANSWLNSQRDLLGVLDSGEGRLPVSVLQAPKAVKATRIDHIYLSF